MKLIPGEKLIESVDGLISAKRQIKPHSIDLTVREVYHLKSKGSLDFGGSEYTSSEMEKIEPVKRDPKDEYGWWDLKAGTYLITLNETIEEIDGIGLISSHPRLLKAGASHPTLVTMEWKHDYILPLIVGENGIDLKENARVSKILVLEHKN